MINFTLTICGFWLHVIIHGKLIGMAIVAVRLNSHRRVVHGQPKPNIKKPYPCPHCPYVAGKSSHLKRHVSRKHTTSDNAYFESAGPMNCEIVCNQSFNLQPQQLYLDIPSSASLQEHTCWEQNNTFRWSFRHVPVGLVATHYWWEHTVTFEFVCLLFDLWLSCVILRGRKLLIHRD